MATKYIVNNVTGQTINGQSVLPTYKVYTALLTQTGEDDPLPILIPEPLVIGRSYLISEYQSGDDFTNVGAPSNATDVWFVATGTTPNNWTNGSYLFFNGGAPVSTVLENTIGNIWFTYDGVGQYSVNSSGLFTTDKTFITIVGGSTNRPDVLVTYATNTDFNIVFYSYRVDNSTGENDRLLNASLEIRVYN